MSHGTAQQQSKGSRFARRIYPARAIGLGLGFVAVASAIMHLSYSSGFWFLLIAYTFAWPHIAYLYATRMSDSFRTGLRQLLFDSFCGGIWVAAMAFNLLPSVLVITMLCMNNMASGGVRLFIQGFVVLVIGLLIGVASFGWEPQWTSSLTVIIACIPFLVIHPLAVGAITHGFATRLQEQKSNLKLLSRTDGLTELYNRRYWQLRAAEEFERSQRNGRPSVLIMLDIDYFKRVNDQHGHLVGDDVLRALSHILSTHLRNIDLLGRYGGEEFAVVLPDMDITAGKQVAERLRTSVANTLLGEKLPLKCTISLGIAELTGDMKSFDEWVNAADQALYNAKAEGRNCTRIYTPEKPVALSVARP